MLGLNADATPAAADWITGMNEMLDKMENVYTYPEETPIQKGVPPQIHATEEYGSEELAGN